MPETTPLIKAALNLRGGAGFDVYEKYGVASHLKNCRTHKKLNFKEYMYGKAYYIKMIEPDLGEEYLRRLDAIRW